MNSSDRAREVRFSETGFLLPMGLILTFR